jgi:hypothetical protein
MEVDGILGGQAFEKRAEDIAFGDAGDDVGIEVGDFIANAAMENLVAVAALHSGLALKAAGKGQQAEDGG